MHSIIFVYSFQECVAWFWLWDIKQTQFEGHPREWNATLYSQGHETWGKTKDLFQIEEDKGDTILIQYVFLDRILNQKEKRDTVDRIWMCLWIGSVLYHISLWISWLGGLYDANVAKCPCFGKYTQEYLGEKWGIMS